MCHLTPPPSPPLPTAQLQFRDAHLVRVYGGGGGMLTTRMVMFTSKEEHNPGILGDCIQTYNYHIPRTL